MYLGNIHNMSLVPVTFGNFFFKSSKNGTFWAKLRRVKMAWTFLLNSALFFGFKNWCKLTPGKKVTWHRRGPGRSSASNYHFCQKNVFFGQKKAFFQRFHFIQKWSVTPNTIFECIKNDFLLSNPKLVFLTEFNLYIKFAT